MSSKVTVVIPTLGRKSLEKAVESALHQTRLPEKILIIDDSIDQSVQAYSDSRIEVLRTGGKKGPAYARNLGMGSSKSEWVAFLDDDDYWLPIHLEKLLKFCIHNKLDASYSSAKVNRRIRPRNPYTGQINPVIEIYSSKNWRRTKLYFPTPGLIISRNVIAHLPFNNNLFEREDLWFAHKLFEYQFKIAQSSDVTVVINQNSKVSISRTNLKSDLEWAERLELIDSKSRDNFLIGIAFRNAFIRRDWAGMRHIAKMYPKENLLFNLLSKL